MWVDGFVDSSMQQLEHARWMQERCLQCWVFAHELIFVQASLWLEISLQEVFVFKLQLLIFSLE